MNSLTLKSPAKINLYLDVLHKRPDGYHEIRTLFERIDLCDTLTFHKTKTDSIISLTATSNRVPLDKKNLASRAAEVLLKKRGKGPGVHIHLEKRIPVAAGLGGGSSNAATTLLGVNQLFGLGLSRKELTRIGRKLGSDVPFFLLESPFALGKGRGDQVQPVRSSLKITHLIVNNKVMVSTREVYKRLNFALTRSGPGVKILKHFVETGDRSAVKEGCFNALENPAITYCPDIVQVKDLLKRYGLEGVLSGSGGSLFAFVKSLDQAKAVRKAILSKQDWDVFICRTY